MVTYSGGRPLLLRRRGERSEPGAKREPGRAKHQENGHGLIEVSACLTTPSGLRPATPPQEEGTPARTHGNCHETFLEEIPATSVAALLVSCCGDPRPEEA